MARYTDSDLQAVVDVIRQAHPKGVAFLIGAGCSITAGIPSAKEFVARIHKAYPHHLHHLASDRHQDYGACMALLTPTERKDLIGTSLGAARINWAHIALACLMQKGFAQRVLTLNFDSVLARACGLIGLYPATYDFGIAPASDVRFLSEPCIIHLHGQGIGPVMMNTGDETEIHAEKLIPLLRDTLVDSTLIVIGYSGIADMIFPHLMANYHSQNRIYWFGHGEEPHQQLQGLFAKPFAKYLGGADADMTLIHIAQSLACFPPCVMTDPAAHLLNEIKTVSDFPATPDFKRDILADLKKRLRDNGGGLKDESGAEGAVLSGEDEGVADDESAPDWIRAHAMFADAYGLGLKGQPNLAISSYDILVTNFMNSTDQTVKIYVAMALFNKAVKLEEIGKVDDAIKTYCELVSSFKNETEFELREQVAKSLNNKGIAYSNKGNFEKAIKSYDEIIDRFGKNKDTQFYEYAAKAFLNKAYALHKSGKFDGAIKSYDDAIKAYDCLIQRYGEKNSVRLIENISNALNNKGILLGSQGKLDEAINNFNIVINSFGNSTESVVLDSVARALFNKELAFTKRNEF